VIDRNEALSQIKRMKILRGYPKGDGAATAEGELVRVVLQHCAGGIQKLAQTINDWIDSKSSVATPAELKDLLLGGSVGPKPLGPCPLKQCDGSGYIPVWSLITDNRDPVSGFKHRTVEDLSQAQYNELREHKLPDEQRVYQSVRRCEHVG